VIAATNGLLTASVTNGLASTNYVIAATNPIPSWITASTNPIPSWITAATNPILPRISAVESYTNRAATAWQNPASSTNWAWTKTATAVTLTGYSGPNDVVIPDMLDGLPVTGFGTIFAGVAITSISGGGNVITIDEGAFGGCEALTSVTLYNVTTIGDDAFGPVVTFKCGALTSVTLPNVTTIGLRAFQFCSSLTSIRLDNAATIGDFAFFGCLAMTSVYFGQNAPAEAEDVYLDTPNVTTYVTSPTATGWGATWNDRPVVRLHGYFDGVTVGGTNLQTLLDGKLGTDDQRVVNALTNGGVTINGIPLGNGTNLTITGGSGGGGGGLSNVVINGVGGTISGSESNKITSFTLNAAGIGAASNTPAGIAAAGGQTNGQILAASQYPLALTNAAAFDAAGTAAAATNPIPAQITAAIDSPYQAYTSVGSVIAGTCTVTYASGSLVRLTATVSPTVLTFDNTNFPTSGVSRVAVELWAGTNSITFPTSRITNSVAPTISTNDWTSLIFRRSGNKAVWTGGQVK
jgi:hypothetical protein